MSMQQISEVSHSSEERSPASEQDSNPDLLDLMKGSQIGVAAQCLHVEESIIEEYLGLLLAWQQSSPSQPVAELSLNIAKQIADARKTIEQRVVKLQNEIHESKDQQQSSRNNNKDNNLAQQPQLNDRQNLENDVNHVEKNILNVMSARDTNKNTLSSSQYYHKARTLNQMKQESNTSMNSDPMMKLPYLQYQQQQSRQTVADKCTQIFSQYVFK